MCFELKAQTNVPANNCHLKVHVLNVLFICSDIQLKYLGQVLWQVQTINFMLATDNEVNSKSVNYSHSNAQTHKCSPAFCSIKKMV